MSAARIARWRRLTWAAAAGGVALCTASGAWLSHAMRPVEPALPDAPRVADVAEPAGPAPLAMAGFAKLLSPPPPPAPESTDPTKDEQRGYRYTLLGVVQQDGRFVAAIHDRGDDRVHFVREGDTLGSATIGHVEGRSVEITTDGTTRRLALASPRKGHAEPPKAPEPAKDGDA